MIAGLPAREAFALGFAAGWVLAWLCAGALWLLARRGEGRR